MKRVIVLVFTAIAVCTIITSCKATLPGRFESFVSSVEKHYESFSEDDWNKANDKFEKLLEEFRQNKASFKPEDKKRITSAIVRYGKVVAKSSYSSVVDAFDEAASYIPDIIDGAKSFLQDLGILDTSEE